MTALPLADLIRGLPLTGEADERPVTGITHDSRRVRPGDLFVAVPGERFDGREFALAAAAAGAAAVVGRGAPPPGLGVPWLAAVEPRALLAPLAARVWDRPDRKMTVVGVTGTNGKSTVATLAAAMLGEAGRPAGVIGSLAYRFGPWSEPAERTTPEAPDLFHLFERMRSAGAEAVAMEVSSHALALGRVAEVAFSAAAFTNLSRDHLDFHGDMESYFAAKSRLFDQLASGGRAVVFTGDPWGRRLAGELAAAGREPLTYGEEGEVRALDRRFSERGIELRAATPRGEVEVRSPLLGRFNSDNLLAALALGEALGLPHVTTAAALAAQRPLPGRLEPVARGQGFPVFVDYSHTPAALEAALKAVRELTGRQVIVVFGCGGERDPGKRRPMGKLAGTLADLPIATTDNPRGEDPSAILRPVEEGLEESGNPRYRIIPDRREAIRRALAVAGPESAVLVAGKGDEAEQIVAGERLRFRDREEIEQALEVRFGQAKAG